MQYFVVDVVVTLLSWASTAIPDVCIWTCIDAIFCCICTYVLEGYSFITYRMVV